MMQVICQVDKKFIASWIKNSTGTVPLQESNYSIIYK